MLLILGRSVNDPETQAMFGDQLSNIERDSYYGALEFKLAGLDVVLKEAGWVFENEHKDDPEELIIVAFHLHRLGHEGYSQYCGALPFDLRFNDDSISVRARLGEPAERGGGKISLVMKTPIPSWHRYDLSCAWLHLQFDSEDRLELLTLEAKMGHRHSD